MMIRETLNKIFSSKAFYIVFSLLVSISLWMYVEITQNQTVRHTVTGVPVVRLNEEILTDRGLLISSMTPDTVWFTFECPRSLIPKLSRETISLAIDLSSITERGNTTVPYELNYPSGIDQDSLSIESRMVSRISLYIDRMNTQPVRVDVPYRGGAAEGFLCDPTEFSPRDVTVNGPAEVVTEIAAARAESSSVTVFCCGANSAA